MIFNFLMDTFFEKVTDKSNFILLLISMLFTSVMKVCMPKRYKQYFSDKHAKVRAELGPAKYYTDMDVNVLTKSMINETFIIKEVYLNYMEKTYLYNIEDVSDGTLYKLVPEKFLCPINPHGLAVNNVSFHSLMESLTADKKERHDIAW